MNKSQLPTVAKKILKKLNTCKSKDVTIGVKGNKFDVFEYGEDAKHPEYTHMDFNYSDSPLPTQEEIEESLYNVFIKILR